MRAIEWIFPHGSRFVEVDMTGSASSVLKTDTRLLSENLFLNYGLESLFK
ncbi:TPA: LuxR family transcriptional regulator, partial [Salmonella enterica subsp. enterica serovar Sandiego]